jgi:hypothetical protein
MKRFSLEETCVKRIDIPNYKKKNKDNNMKLVPFMGSQSDRIVVPKYLFLKIIPQCEYSFTSLYFSDESSKRVKMKGARGVYVTKGRCQKEISKKKKSHR